MSTFGYRRELSKYEDLDEDELLASLTAEELQELEKELADIDPDDNLPIGLRQRDQTAKTPTGTFSREALMKYWENETRKLLEEERIGSTSPREVSDPQPQTLPALATLKRHKFVPYLSLKGTFWYLRVVICSLKVVKCTIL